MNGKSVVLINWAAWTPGLFEKEEWKSYFNGSAIDTNRPDPLVNEIPPLMRRRMTRTGRMSAATAFQCLKETHTSPEEVPIVFSSRHGEMAALVNILDGLARGESISPTAFSHSVHHTTASAFSIATGNTRELRSVAGGETTFPYGFLDSVGLLYEKDHSRVLYISSDDEVPEIFAGVLDNRGTPFSVALLLGREGDGESKPIRFNFHVEETPSSPTMGVMRNRPDPINFVQWVHSSSNSFTLNHGGIQWVWTR